MNPTFQRLLDQATIDALHATQDAQDYAGNPVARQQRELQLEKFAELIVRECADLAKKKAFVIMQKAEEYAADKEEMITATSAAFKVEILGQEIQKHFGVEE
jgi:hypothetical protein